MSNLSVCVFCGARSGQNPAYQQAATETGAMLARRGIRLVYGAGDMGLMGAVAQSVKEAGGDTLGVIPTHLIPRERGGRMPHDAIVTDNMHTRKKVMFTNSDAVLMLPGGAGSLDEIFEVLTWRQIGLHEKPILVLNVAGYWNPFLALIDHVIDQGFADGSMREMVTVCADVDAVEAALAQL